MVSILQFNKLQGKKISLISRLIGLEKKALLVLLSVLFRYNLYVYTTSFHSTDMDYNIFQDIFSRAVNDYAGLSEESFT